MSSSAGYHAEDGLYELRVPGSSVDVQDWSDLVEGAIVEARVTGSNVGGLECMVGHIRGFIPASQIDDVPRGAITPEYYEKKLLCVVTEANERRRNLVLSHRALLERERKSSGRSCWKNCRWATSARAPSPASATSARLSTSAGWTAWCTSAN